MGINLRKAELFARFAHDGQFYGRDDPYINHCMRVAKRLYSWGERDRDTLQAAILHDVIEDSNISEYFLSKLFGDEVSYIVFLLTRGDNYTYEEYINTSVINDRRAAKIKLADLLENIHYTTSNTSDSWPYRKHLERWTIAYNKLYKYLKAT